MTNAFRGEFTLELEGKTYEGLLNLNAIRLLTQANGIGLEDIDDHMKKDALAGICGMAYWAIKNKAVRTGKDSGLMGFEQFCAIVLDDMAAFDALSNTITNALTPETVEGGGNE